MTSTDNRPFVPILDQRVLARLHDTIRAVQIGSRPPLSAAELERFASELRRDTNVRVHIREIDLPGQVGLVIRVDGNPKSSAVLSVLTPREREVALLIADGLTNREIAESLGLSVSTVKDHVHRILFRMKVTSRLAVARAVLTDRDAPAASSAASDDC